MIEQVNIYYKPLNKFNIQDKYYNVYLNKNNNLYFPFLKNTIPISKITVSLEKNMYKELYNITINNINFLKKTINEINIINKNINNYINNQESIIKKIKIKDDNNE